MLRATFAMAVCLLVSGCITQPPAPVSVRDVGSRMGGDVEQQAAGAVPAIVLPRVRPGAQPVRAINASVQCAFADEVGTRGHLNLQVEEADVKHFLAQVTMPKRGVCNFDLRDFHQTARLPAVVLASSKDVCSVRMWEQGSQVTVAFSNCEAYCSGDAFTYLWPILADRPSGTCS
jgi:hypothetical protein